MKINARLKEQPFESNPIGQLEYKIGIGFSLFGSKVELNEIEILHTFEEIERIATSDNKNIYGYVRILEYLQNEEIK